MASAFAMSLVKKTKEPSPCLPEIASDLLNPVAEWAITGTEPEYELEQIIEDGAVGVLTALIARGGARVMNTAVGNRKAAASDGTTGSTEKPALGNGIELVGETEPEKPGRRLQEGFKLMKDYQRADGTYDMESARLDYKNLLQMMPEKHKMYLEQSLGVAEFEVSEDPDIIFGYKGKTDKFVYNPYNEAFGYYDIGVMFTHELAHRVDRFFVRSTRNARFVRAIQDAEKVLEADSEFFVKFCEENDQDGFCSDIMSAICKNKYDFPTGHKEGYWTPSRQAAEIFADLFSLEGWQSVKEMDFLRKYFPELIASFEALEFSIY